MRDNTGRYTFDEISRMKTVSLPSTQRLTYAYDAIGQRNYLTAPTGGRFTYSFDAFGRITNVLNPEGNQTMYSYDTAGRRTVAKFANGGRTSYTYDNADQMTIVANIKKSLNGYQSKYDYKYDQAGNRTSVVEESGARVTWTYDATNHLLVERRSGVNAYRNTFTYHSRGNRTLKNESGSRTTYSYDAGNQLTASRNPAGTRTTYVFDASGNQQVVIDSASRVTTTWDYENQPTRYNQPANLTYPIVTMAYNADNQRVQKQSPVGTTKFLWDEQNYVAEADVSNVIQTVYTNEPQHYGNLISTRLGTTPYYHHFDALGSTRQLTNSAQTPTDTWLYDAWGNVTARTGTTAAFLQWIGQFGYYYDAETGLLWVRARPLLPLLGRWLCTDPAAYVDGLTLYVYVRNSSAFLVDPNGKGYIPPDGPSAGTYCDIRQQDCPQQSDNRTWYGCHCRAGNPNHDADEPGDPIDQLDKGCNSHDSCYGKIDPPCRGVTVRLIPPGFVYDNRPHCVQCDQDFCQSLRNSDCNGWTDTAERAACNDYRANAMFVFGCTRRFDIPAPPR